MKFYTVDGENPKVKISLLADKIQWPVFLFSLTFTLALVGICMFCWEYQKVQVNNTKVIHKRTYRRNFGVSQTVIIAMHWRI